MQALLTAGEYVYIGGECTTTGNSNVSIGGLARWSSLGNIEPVIGTSMAVSGTDGQVNAFADMGDRIAFAGEFSKLVRGSQKRRRGCMSGCSWAQTSTGQHSSSFLIGSISRGFSPSTPQVRFGDSSFDLPVDGLAAYFKFGGIFDGIVGSGATGRPAGEVAAATFYNNVLYVGGDFPEDSNGDAMGNMYVTLAEACATTH